MKIRINGARARAARAEDECGALNTAVHDLARALRLTQEYVGDDLLPPIEGWEWYDALKRHAPEYLATESDPESPEDTREEIG